MQYITVSESFIAVLRIPTSQASDTVTYSIRKASDGTVFSSGSATHVADNYWKVAFTPTTVNETYIVELFDSTIDVESAEMFKAVQDQPVTVDQTEATTASALLIKVESAISSRLNGGGVNSYRLEDGRNLEYMKLDELRMFRRELKREVASSRTAKQTTTHARFHRPL